MLRRVDNEQTKLPQWINKQDTATPSITKNHTLWLLNNIRQCICLLTLKFRFINLNNQLKCKIINDTIWSQHLKPFKALTSCHCFNFLSWFSPSPIRCRCEQIQQLSLSFKPVHLFFVKVTAGWTWSIKHDTMVQLEAYEYETFPS